MRTYEAWEIMKEKSELSLLLISYRLLTTTMATQSSCRLVASTGFPGEGVCTEEGRAMRAAFLRILDYDSRPAETVSPEPAVQRVCGMRLAAVSAKGRVGARSSLLDLVPQCALPLCPSSSTPSFCRTTSTTLISYCSCILHLSACLLDLADPDYHHAPPPPRSQP